MVQDLVDVPQQVCNRQVEGLRNGLQCPQAGFFAPLLKVRNEILVKPGLLSKVDLSPATLGSQLTYSLSQSVADVPCHHPIVGFNSAVHPLYSVIVLREGVFGGSSPVQVGGD